MPRCLQYSPQRPTPETDARVTSSQESVEICDVAPGCETNMCVTACSVSRNVNRNKLTSCGLGVDPVVVYVSRLLLTYPRNKECTCHARVHVFVLSSIHRATITNRAICAVQCNHHLILLQLVISRLVRRPRVWPCVGGGWQVESVDGLSLWCRAGVVHIATLQGNCGEV